VAIILTDADIAQLLTEPKTLPADYQSRLQPRAKVGHKERELDIAGASGSEFQVIVRQSIFNPLDFSVILGYSVPKSSVLFRLRRYNGRSHEHTNQLEGITFYDFHIHTATERYQDAGYAEEHFAEVTDRYVDLNGAIRCLIDDCAFELPPGTQGSFL
jgi:hypothetical protein